MADAGAVRGGDGGATNHDSRAGCPARLSDQQFYLNPAVFAAEPACRATNHKPEYA